MDEGNAAVLEQPLRRHPNQNPPAVTKLKQDKFIAFLTQTGELRKSCVSAGIDYNTPYQWAQRSDAFAKRFDDAKVKGEKVLLDRIEEQIDKRVFTGADDPQSAVLTMFRTKRLDPRYRDNAVVNVNAVGPVAIQFNLNTQAPTEAAPSLDENKQS